MKTKLVFKRFIANFIDTFLGLQIFMTITIFLLAFMITFGLIRDYKKIYMILYAVVANLVIPLFKDIFGRSLGKKILGITIIDSKTNSRPKRWKLVLRNIFMPIPLFLEGVVCLATGKKIGDHIFGLDVVSVPEEKKRNKKRKSKKR